MSEANLAPRRRILVVMAHPDDAEFMCGGTLARWAREGHSIHYCLCTDGNHGSSDPDMTPTKLAEIRKVEQRAACAHFNCDDVTFLGYDDSELEPTLDVRRDITRAIRRIRPHVIVCQDPTMRWTDTYVNHPDHRAAGEATLAAVMPAASTRLIFPELLVENLEPYKVSEVYLMGTNHADTWIALDEADVRTKIAALLEHKSQLGDWHPEERMLAWAKEGGERARAAGVAAEYAEGFKHIRLLNIEETLAQEAEAHAMEN